MSKKNISEQVLSDFLSIASELIEKGDITLGLKEKNVKLLVMKSYLKKNKIGDRFINEVVRILEEKEKSKEKSKESKEKSKESKEKSKESKEKSKEPRKESKSEEKSDDSGENNDDDNAKKKEKESSQSSNDSNNKPIQLRGDESKYGEILFEGPVRVQIYGKGILFYVVDLKNEKIVKKTKGDEVKEKLKEMGGKWNPSLKGWIFSSKKQEDLLELVNDVRW